MKHIKLNIVVVVVVASLSLSCGRKQPLSIECGDFTEICELGEELQVIGIPTSFDIVNDSLFVVSDNGKVFTYNFSGEQVAQIGNAGNAWCEYIIPSAVCADKDSIYVWSSATMKFISFSLDGKPGSEYEYPSAVQNFVSKGDCFWIYTAGRRGDNILDRYCKLDKSVIGIENTSIEHQVLSMNASSSPILVMEEGIAFCPKDKLTVNFYDELSEQVVNRGSFDSETFSVESLSPDAMRMEGAERSKYLRANPLVLAVLPCEESGYKILTLEGMTESIGDEISNDSRFYGLYWDRKGKIAVRYLSPQTFGYWHLMRVHNGSLFFIRHKMTDQAEVYSLCRFEFPKGD